MKEKNRPSTRSFPARVDAPPITQSQSSKLNLSTSYPSLFRMSSTARKIEIRGPRVRAVPSSSLKLKRKRTAETYCFCQSASSSRFLKVRQATGIPRGPESTSDPTSENSLTREQSLGSLPSSVYFLLIIRGCYRNLRISNLQEICSTNKKYGIDATLIFSFMFIYTNKRNNNRNWSYSVD